MGVQDLLSKFLKKESVPSKLDDSPNPPPPEVPKEMQHLEPPPPQQLNPFSPLQGQWGSTQQAQPPQNINPPSNIQPPVESQADLLLKQKFQDQQNYQAIYPPMPPPKATPSQQEVQELLKMMPQEMTQSQTPINFVETIKRIEEKLDMMYKKMDIMEGEIKNIWNFLQTWKRI